MEEMTENNKVVESVMGALVGVMEVVVEVVMWSSVDKLVTNLEVAEVGIASGKWECWR